VTRLLPPEERSRAWARQAAALPLSCAHVAVYLGFKGDIRAAGATNHNEWHYADWDLDLSGWRVSAAEPVSPSPMVYFCFPSLKDRAHDPGAEQRHTGQILTIVPFEPFARWDDQPWRQRGADYDAFKQRLQAVLLGQLFARFPRLEPMLDYVELSTPLSTNTFCRPIAGAMYGPMPTPARFLSRWLRPRSPIGNLFFAGNDVASPGIIGAAMGGVVCALSASPVGTLRLLAQVR
jgi:all-trans-retinol 13,14-reductase